MKANFLNELEDHLHALNDEIKTLIERNESMMMQCPNFDKSLPYLKQYYDLSSMKAMNHGYIHDMNFGRASAASSEAPAKRLNLEPLG